MARTRTRSAVPGMVISQGLWTRHYGGDPHRFFLLPWAIDNERFMVESTFEPGEREAMRARLGIRDDELAVVFSGKLVPRKDPMTLLGIAMVAVGVARFNRRAGWGVENGSSRRPTGLRTSLPRQVRLPRSCAKRIKICAVRCGVPNPRPCSDGRSAHPTGASSREGTRVGWRPARVASSANQTASRTAQPPGSLLK